MNSSGYFDLTQFEEQILPYIDLIYYDIKLFDSNRHEKYTKKDNVEILSNFSYLYRSNKVKIIPRIPLIPNITADLNNLKEITNFLKKCGCNDLKLLPYNPGGIKKLMKLGKAIPPEISQSFLDIKAEERLKRKAIEFLSSTRS